MPRNIAVGLNKGFVTTKIDPKKAAKSPRPSLRKGKLGKRVEIIRGVIKSVCGLAPYEKRIVELLRVGSSKDSKKALKLAKARLGTHRRGLKKREALEEWLRQQKKKHQEQH